jgi:hypothetical protein
VQDLRNPIGCEVKDASNYQKGDNLDRGRSPRFSGETLVIDLGVALFKLNFKGNIFCPPLREICAIVRRMFSFVK